MPRIKEFSNRTSLLNAHIPPELHQRLKLRAVSERKTLESVVNELLTEALGEKPGAFDERVPGSDRFAAPMGMEEVSRRLEKYKQQEAAARLAKKARKK